MHTAGTRSALSLFLLREESGIFDRTDSSLVQVAVLLFSVELSLVTKVIERTFYLLHILLLLVCPFLIAWFVVHRAQLARELKGQHETLTQHIQ